MSSASLPVERISDTAFLTALYRAMESERRDAHFQDPYARDLAGARGEQLSHEIPEENSVAKGCAIRTCIVDELILRLVAQNGIDTILNLGSGLDTRPYRLPLPPALHWIEGDQPDILTYKADKLSTVNPVCSLDSLVVDINDATSLQMLFQRIASNSHEGFVLTEGILIYMTESQVAALARALHSQIKLRWWLSDLASPIALGQFQQLCSGTAAGSEAKMQFAPEDGSEFFRRYGWEAVEFYSLIEEGERLNRSILPAHVRARLSYGEWEIIRRLSGCVLLKRLDS